MAAIRCPECKAKVTVSDDGLFATVACRACGFIIRLDDDAGAYSAKPMSRKESRVDDAPRRRRSVDDDDEDRPIKKKKKKTNPLLKAGKRALDSLSLPIKIILGLALLALLVSCAHPFLYVVPMAYGLILMLIGGFMFLVAVFTDSPLEFVLCCVIPGYSLYYLVTHWDEAKAAFFLQVFGMVVCFSFICAMPFHAVFFGVRGAIMGKPAANEQAAANPLAKGGPELPGAVNPPEIKPPIQKGPAARITGDVELDQALADIGSKDGKTCQNGANVLKGRRPDQHQASVAKKLADEALAAPLYNRTPVLKAMQTWATAREVPALLQLLQDQDINTRNETLQVLGKLRDERAAAPMVRCFMDLRTTYWAERALIEMGPVAEKEVLPIATGPDRDKWVPAIRVLKEIGTQQSVPTLEALTKGDITVQYAAGDAVKAINGRLKK